MKPAEDSYEEKKLSKDKLLQRLEDLELINSVNVAINRGESLEKVIELINIKTKELCLGSGLTTYLLSDDGKYLEMYGPCIPSAQKRKIESLIKTKIPKVRLPLREGSYYYRVLKERKAVIIDDAAEIKKIIAGFAETLPEKQKILRNLAKKLIPQIYNILNIKSILIAPLISGEDAIGLIDMSCRGAFDGCNLARIGIIFEQLVIAIRRKKIEEELEDAYEELKQVFEASVDGITIVDRDYTILKANKVLVDLFGFDSKEIMGKKCFEVFGGPECNTSDCVIRRILNGQEYITIEMEKENRHGEKITCILSANPIRNQKGEIIGIVECYKDITSYREAFKEIKESGSRFKELFDNMSSGVVVYEVLKNGKDFIIKDFNKAAETIDKINREPIIGKNVLEVFPGIKDFGLYDVFKRVYRTGEPEKYPISLYKDNRITGWRRNYVYKLPSGEIVTVYDDLTRQKQVEDSLKESEEFSTSLMENSPNPIIVINKDYSIKYVNPALESIVGLKSNKLLGKKPPYPWWPERLIAKNNIWFKNDMKKGCTGRELLLANSVGEEFWIETYDKLVFSEGKLKYVIINWFDITNRKLMENDLKESYNELREALQGTINALGSIVEKRDPYTSGHQKRVSRLAVAISRELGLGSELINCIKTASDIHDIGKINIPVSILTKPGRLTNIEFDLIKTHPDVGYEMVKEIKFSMPVAEIILEHHEKLDGSGYPKGLKEKDIMFEAKILTVADVVEAMSSDRPYRPALGIDIAVDEIKKNRGKLYDPRVVDACIKIVTKKGFKFD